MFDPAKWPNWLQIARLIFTFALTTGFGIHAFNAHKLEVINTISPRKWMYWLYSVVFFVASIANFTQLCVTFILHDYAKSSFHIGYSTVLLVLSYIALLAGVRRKTYN